jgi:hypothetical protein
MRINRVSIQGFRAIDNIDLDFRDELGLPKGAVTLAGPNGCGKTSVLYAITDALRGAFGYRTKDVPLPSRDDLRVSQPGSSWSSIPPNVRVSAEISFTPEEQNDIREILRILERQPPPNLPDGCLTVDWTYPPPIDPSGTRYNVFHTSISPALPNVRSWLHVKSWAIQGWKKRIPGVAERLPTLGGLYFFPQDRDLRRRVGAGLTAEDRDEGYTTPSFTRPTVYQVLDEFSRRFSKTPEVDPHNWESHVKRLYSIICAPKTYVGFQYREDTPAGSPVFADGGHTYPLSHAASGEHVILEYIVELCRFGPLNRSIILIDEPEVHLHPLWIRRLYINLPQFGEGNQFILTTHSPELRQRASSDNSLIELGRLEDGD